MTATTRETTKPHRSYSQLNMFQRCSMQYYFRYVLGQKSRPALPLAMGKAGHSAVEMNSRHKMKTGADQSVEQLLDNFSTFYDNEVSQLEPSDLKPGDNIGRTKDATTEVVRFYRLAKAPLIAPRAVEIPFTLNIPLTDEHDYPVDPIVGFIDVLWEQGFDETTIPGRPPRPLPRPQLNLDDFKFTSRMKAQAEVDLTTQLDLYDVVLADAGIPADSVGLRVMIPATSKTPARAERLARDPALMTPEARAARRARLYYKFRTAQRAIDAGIFIPTDDPKVCAWCSYREQCQFSLVKRDYDALQIRQQGATIR